MTSMIDTLLRDHTFRAVHLVAILRALQGYYVIPGQEPAISQRGAGANMSVDIGAFKYVLAGVFGEKLTTTNVVIGAADATKPRIDIIYVNASGTIAVLAGTAKAVKPVGESTWQKWEEPYPADISSTQGLILAEVEVPAAATSIINAYIRNCCVRTGDNSADVFDVREYGAICDGITDDTAALQAALTAASGGGTVLLSQGTMLITAACNPASWAGVSVFGLGSSSVIKLGGDVSLFTIDAKVDIGNFTIQVPAANTAPVLLFNADYEHSKIHDISFIGLAANGGWTAIKITDHGHGSVFSDLKIADPAIGIDLLSDGAGHYITDLSFDRISIDGMDVGIRLDITSPGYGVHGNTWSHIHILQSKATASKGIQVLKGNNNIFYGVVTWNDGAGEFRAIELAAGTSGHQFRGGHIEGLITDDGRNILDFFHLNRDTAGAISLENALDFRGHRNILKNGSFGMFAGAAPDFWEAGPNATFTKVTANDMNHLKITGTAGANGTFAIQVIPRALRRQDVVTVGAWVKAASTNTHTNVRLEVSQEGWATQSNSSNLPNDDAWHWVTVSHYLGGDMHGMFVVLRVDTEDYSTDEAEFRDVVCVAGPVAYPECFPFVEEETKKTGSATITAAATSVNVTHYLGTTPKIVTLTPTTDTGGKRYWVSAKGATTFTITIDSAHGSNIAFDYVASARAD